LHFLQSSILTWLKVEASPLHCPKKAAGTGLATAFAVPTHRHMPMPPMPNKTRQGNARRSFLQTSASAGLLGAALALLSRTPAVQAAPQPATSDTNQPSPSGYHETDHIRKYYAKARQF
jgi:hypothetical protein